MDDLNEEKERPEVTLLRTKSETLKADQTVLEDWAAVFLMVQQLEKAAGIAGRPLFHEEPGREPLVIPGRATIWPAELQPFGHLTYRAQARTNGRNNA